MGCTIPLFHPDIGQLAAAGDVSGLIKALKHPSLRIRTDAAAALRVLRSKANLSPSYVLPPNGPDVGRQRPTDGSVIFDRSRAQQVVLKLLLDDSPTVRQRVITTLERPEGSKVLDLLFAAYYHGDKDIRKKVVMVLHDMKNEAEVLARLKRFKYSTQKMSSPGYSSSR